MLRTLRPRGLLLLCVANSARSQMAEGLARSVAGADLWIGSAGSEPAAVRPEAIAVLAELGIDIRHQRSTSVDDVPRERVDAVITLCDEEVCPVFGAPVHRLHWGLPDPAAVADEEERLRAFRAVRDELRRRLGVLFGVEPR